MESLECRCARLVTEAIFAQLKKDDILKHEDEEMQLRCYLAALAVIRPIIDEVDNAERC